jgi:hypothetical protein
LQKLERKYIATTRLDSSKQLISDVSPASPPPCRYRISYAAMRTVPDAKMTTPIEEELEVSKAEQAFVRESQEIGQPPILRLQFP